MRRPPNGPGSLVIAALVAAAFIEVSKPLWKGIGKGLEGLGKKLQESGSGCGCGHPDCRCPGPAKTEEGCCGMDDCAEAAEEEVACCGEAGCGCTGGVSVEDTVEDAVEEAVEDGETVVAEANEPSASDAELEALRAELAETQRRLADAEAALRSGDQGHHEHHEHHEGHHDGGHEGHHG